jgi:hypothetical protein
LTPACRHIKLTGVAKPFAVTVKLITPKRRWAQFSLATMFVVVTALCVGCAWLAIQMNRANKQRDAVAAIEALGGDVMYAEPDQGADEAFPRPYLRRWLPRDYVDDVVWVDLDGTDAGLAQLQVLTGLQVLYLRGTPVTDAGLAQLHGLTGLHELFLDGTQVTDSGLAQLQKALPNCWIKVR